MRKFKCIKSYCSGEWLTKNKIYELSKDGEITYDDGWTNTLEEYNILDNGNKIIGYNLIEIKEEDKKVDERSITITTNGNTTHALLKEGNRVIKHAKVGLYYTDEYKFETGVIEVVKKLFDIVDEKVEVEEEPKKFVKAKVGDKIRVINQNNEHCPCVNNGDIHIVTDVYEHSIDTDKENSFNDVEEEYEIIGQLENLSSYSSSELLDELKRRMEK